jgi:hypothetical protein
MRSAWALGIVLLGCDPGPPAAPPQAVTTLRQATAIEEVAPVPIDVDLLRQTWPAMGSLPIADATVLGVAMSNVPTSCGACDALSLAACAERAPPACGDLPRLVARAARLKREGVSLNDLQAALSYGDLWFDVPPGSGPVMGVADAPVRLVLYVDPAASLSVAAIAHARKLALDPRVRVELRHPSAAATDAQRLAWQTALGPLLPTSPTMEAFAAQAAADQAEATALGVRSLPTWFLDGFRLRGARTEYNLREMVDRHLADLADAPPPAGAPG